MFYFHVIGISVVILLMISSVVIVIMAFFARSERDRRCQDKAYVAMYYKELLDLGIFKKKKKERIPNVALQKTSKIRH